METKHIEAADQIAEATGQDSFDLALILGSGWDSAAELIGQTTALIPADQIAGFNPSAIPGHLGKLHAIVTPVGHHVLLLGARQHFYEGRCAQTVAHPVRVAAALGVRQLIVTNGCGSLRPELPPGQVALISDHINLTGATPLVGATFVDMIGAYSPRLRALVQTHLDLPEAVYAQFAGPQYETPAEVRMARVLGADLVGMSTALETIAAREAGLEVLGLSLVTNFAAGFGTGTLSHAEVLAMGHEFGPRISALLADAVQLILTRPMAEAL